MGETEIKRELLYTGVKAGSYNIQTLVENWSELTVDNFVYVPTQSATVQSSGFYTAGGVGTIYGSGKYTAPSISYTNTTGIVKISGNAITGYIRNENGISSNLKGNIYCFH